MTQDIPTIVRRFLHDLLTNLLTPPRPDVSLLNLKRKEQIAMSIFKETYSLPPATAADVQIQRFSVSGTQTQALTDYLQANAIDQGGFPIIVDYPASQTESGEFYVDLPDDITLSIEDIDANGNSLGPVSKTIHEIDDVAPPTPDPAALGVASKVQV